MQTYSTDPAADMNHEDEYGHPQPQEEYITKMFEFTKQQAVGDDDPRHVPVRLIVSKRDQMEVRIGRYGGQANSPKPKQLNNTEAFRHSMWPYLD